MATTSGRSRRPAPAPVASGTRGLILVACAVFVGVLLLWKGGGEQVADAAGSDVLGDGGSSESGATTTTVATTLVPPAQLKVVVVNASGKTGVAKTKGQELQGKGYANTSWITATQNSPDTVVYFAPDAQGESNAVAAALGLDPSTTVHPLPSPPPGTDKGIPPDAKTVVMIGADQAGQ